MMKGTSRNRCRISERLLSLRQSSFRLGVDSCVLNPGAQLQPFYKLRLSYRLERVHPSSQEVRAKQRRAEC